MPTPTTDARVGSPGAQMKLNSSTREELCRPEFLQVHEAHFRRLDSLFTGENPETVFVVRGTLGEGKCDPYAEPERWVHEVLDCLAEQADNCNDPEIFRPLCLQFEPYGIPFDLTIYVCIRR